MRELIIPQGMPVYQDKQGRFYVIPRTYYAYTGDLVTGDWISLSEDGPLWEVMGISFDSCSKPEIQYFWKLQTVDTSVIRQSIEVPKHTKVFLHRVIVEVV